MALIINFFIPLKKIPTVTHQQKRVTTKNGKPQFYDSDKLKDARSLFTAHLSQYAPKEKITGPIRLLTKWCWASTKHAPGTYKTTKPDTDNMIKLLKDCMTDVGYWHDDSQVASEITEKFWGDIQGIYIFVYQLEDDHD